MLAAPGRVLKEDKADTCVTPIKVIMDQSSVSLEDLPFIDGTLRT